MAGMRKKQKDIAELGPIGILREGLKLYRAHAKVFFLIQVMLILPVAIVALGLQYYALSPVPPNLNGRSLHVPHWLRLLRLSHVPIADLTGSPLLVLRLLLTSNALSFVYQMALSLGESTSVYSVGLHYNGRPIAYLDVVRAAVPRLWMRMAVTNIWLWVFAFLLSLVTNSSAIVFHSGALPVPWVFFGITSVVLLGVGVYLDIIFMIAPGVSVLEEDYGSAAVMKSEKLLKGRIRVALLFKLLWTVPVAIRVGIPSYMESQMVHGHFSAWTGTQLFLITVVSLASTTIVRQLQYLYSGVQYVSFKAHHNESLPDPLSENQKPKGGYVAVGDGSQAPLLDGQEAGNTI